MFRQSTLLWRNFDITGWVATLVAGIRRKRTALLARPACVPSPEAICPPSGTSQARMDDAGEGSRATRRQVLGATAGALAVGALPRHGAAQTDVDATPARE